MRSLVAALILATAVSAADVRNPQIDQILAIEGRTTHVPTAMMLKRTGLPHVRHLADFLHLMTSPQPAPPKEYRDARSELIAQEIGMYVLETSKIETILEIEKLTTRVRHALAVKSAGLTACRSSADFARLTSSSFPDASAAYGEAIGAFIARQAPMYLGDGGIPIVSNSGSSPYFRRPSRR